MKHRFAAIFLLNTLAVALGAHPIRENAVREPSVLTSIVEDNKNLDPGDPRELGMKVRSLLRDEYTFFRGCAAAFYRLSSPLVKDWMADQAGWVLLHGDIHIGNVGTYQGPGAAGRDIHFGVVDLDEVVHGPFQLDLLRALVAVRFAAGTKSGSIGEQEAQALCDGYAHTLSGEATYQELIIQNPAAAALLRKAAKNEARKYIARYAELDSSPHFRTTRIKDGQVKDLLEPLSDATRDQVIDAVWGYLAGGCDPHIRDHWRFQNRDELRRAVFGAVRWTRLESSGSQGVHKYLVLLDKPLKDEDTPLILELKEQPVPAAAVVGLLPSAKGIERAKEVAGSYSHMLDPPPRLIGFTQMNGRGFLVRTKDPWNEDLEPTDFGIGQAIDGTVKAAALLGEVLGLAHRAGLIRSNQSDRIPAMLDRLASLAPGLNEMSKKTEEQLRREYQALKADPKAQALAAKAEEYIKQFAAEKP